MHPLIGYIIIVGIVVVGIGLVMISGLPVVDKAKANLEFREAEGFLSKLDTSIAEVVREGQGSTRLVRSGDGSYRVSSVEDLVEFRQSSSLFDYLVRKVNDGILLISGADVSCNEIDVNGGEKELVMENSYIGIALKKVNGTYNTKDNIVMIRTKENTIQPTDSSIVIDGDSSTSSGVGLSLLERTGENLPKCRVRYIMNSTLDYEIFYTLYSGADFVTIEVKNIRS